MDITTITGRIRPLNTLEFWVLTILCIATIGIALHDQYTLKVVEQRCLNDCNIHWVKEFEGKCMGMYGQKENIMALQYNYSMMDYYDEGNT